MEKFDLTVIGSGPGGYIAAFRASQLGSEKLAEYKKLKVELDEAKKKIAQEVQELTSKFPVPGLDL